MLLSCDRQTQVRGQLIITFQTDMELPDQIDNLLVQVSRRGGEVLLMQSYPLGATRTSYKVPGSLGLVAGQSTEPLTITVAGSKNDVWRTYREIVTTVPRERVAELRMPIQWLCNDAAQPQYMSVSDGKGGVVNRVVKVCEDGFTCKAGSCVPNAVDSAALPDYAPQALYGGADQPDAGACFDVLECMQSGNAVEPDGDCTIPAPDGANINVGLRVAGGGICNEVGPTMTCFVPLDGESDEGWTRSADGTRLQLPKAVCRRIAERKVLAVQMSTACPTKAASQPPCGAWSSVPDDHAITPDPGSSAPSPPSPQLFASLPTSGASLCCPLLSDGDQLYSCTCSTMDGNGNGKATVYGIDEGSAERQAFPLDMRPTVAATVYNHTLYWAADHNLYQLPLQAGSMLTSFAGRGGLYTDGVLQADESGVYALTSGVDDAAATDASAVVQLLRFSRSGTIESMDALGNRVVKQFAQDAGAFYAAMNIDQVPQGSQAPMDADSMDKPFQRISSVVRIDKQTHRRSTVLNEQIMMITDFRYYGYLGVVSDGSDLFALFESTPDSAGNERLQIGRVPQASSAEAADLAPIYELTVSADQHLTSLRLLGAIDGAVLFVREERERPDKLRSSSVLLIPRDSSEARFVADFTNDAAASGLAASADNVFWLNQSGRIFALSREALAP